MHANIYYDRNVPGKSTCLFILFFILVPTPRPSLSYATFFSFFSCFGPDFILVQEMEKAVNKPWRMLYWEQRVALPIRERLRSNYRYVDVGFDIDQRFGSAAGIDNLRKWVRSQRTQETERVEAERTRLPDASPGRPLSEVQKLRAQVFADIVAADKAAAADAGEAGESCATPPIVPAVAGVAGGGGGGGTQSQSRESISTLDPLSTLFTPPNASNNGGRSTSTAAAVSVAAGVGGVGAASISNDTGELARAAYASSNGKGPAPAPSPAADADPHSRRPTPDPRVSIASSAELSGGAGGEQSAAALSQVTGGGVSTSGGVVVTYATAPVGAGAGGGVESRGAVRRRKASESTPDDFRRDLSSSKKKAKVDYTEVVNKILLQLDSLALAPEAVEMLVESLLPKTSMSRESLVSSSSQVDAVGDAGAGEGKLTFEERQLLLNERVQASKEVDAAQGLAERRLKLMGEMRAAGNESITEAVIEQQRLVVLGLEPPLLPRHAGGAVLRSPMM